MFKKMTLLVVALAFASTAAYAKNIKFCGTKFHVPKKLKAEKEDFGWALASKDEDLGIIFMCLDGNNVEAAGQELENQVKKMIPDFKENPEDEGEIDLNGMKAFTAGGAGTMEGESVEVGLLMAVTPKGKVLTMFGIIAKNKIKKYDPVMGKLITSIKPR